MSAIVWDSKKVLEKKFYILATICVTLVGCAAPKAGSCAQSISGNKSKTMSAVIEYSDRFCAAFVDVYKVTADTAQMLVWTAGHCTPLATAHADKPTVRPRLSIADENGVFFAPVEIEDSFTARNLAAKTLAKELTSSDPDLSKYILKTNRVYDLPGKSICRLASDKANADPSTQDGIKTIEAAAVQERMGANSTELCFSTFELAAMTVNLQRSKAVEALVTEKEAASFWAVLTASVGQKSSLNSTSTTEKKMQANILKLGTDFRFVSSTSLIDFLRWCKSPAEYQEEPIPNLPFVTSTASCSSVSKIQNFIGTGVIESGFDESQNLTRVSLKDYAIAAGFDPSRPLEVKKSALSFFGLSDVWGDNVNEVAEFVVDKITKETGLVSLNLANKIISLNSLVDPSKVDFSPKFQRVFRFFIPKDKTEAVFKKGDSGSILLYKGQVPLGSLHAVGDDLTSGGAATVSLPRRQSGASSGAGSSSTTKDSGSKQQTASAGRSDDAEPKASSCN